MNPKLWTQKQGRLAPFQSNLKLFAGKLQTLGRSGDGVGTIQFTGPHRGVGASTIAFNLAMIMAEEMGDQRVLLVDANVEHPALHRAFDLTPSPGLLDMFLKGRKAEEVIVKSSLPNLDVVPVGDTDRRTALPFDIVKFRGFLNEARTGYRFILVDSAPALFDSHSRLIAGEVDGVIVVVEANQTRWEVVAEIKDQLESDGGKVLGAVLNKRRFVIPKWAYRFI